METNVQALKDLYVALGGEASDVVDMTTSSEVLVALQAVAQAAATELPVVTKSDAGKLLTVNGSGKWAAVRNNNQVWSGTAVNGKLYSLKDFPITAVYDGVDVVIVLTNLSIDGSTFVFVRIPMVGVQMNTCYFCTALRLSGKTAYVTVTVPQSLEEANSSVTVDIVADPTTPENVPEA